MRTFIRRLRPRTWIIAGAVVVVVAGASVYWFGFGLPGTAPRAQATTRTVTVSTQTLEQTVSGTGTLVPTVDEDVDFAASGTVTSVKVTEGDTVKKGQKLATIDDLTVKANLLSAKATLASAQASLSNDEADGDGSTSSQAAIAADKAAVAQAKDAVKTAKKAAKSTTLTAPVAGLVTAVNVEKGDQVSASSSSDANSASSSGSSGSGSGSSGFGGVSGASSSGSSSSSSAPFEIVGTSSWQTSVSVSASGVKKLAKGQQVELSTDDNPSFFGTVSSIGALPSTSSGSATYPVVVSVTGSPDDLYDGVSVTAKIVYKRVANELVVPSLAVTTSNGTSTVQKMVDGKKVKTKVGVGISSGTYTQITSGLSSGDSVALDIFTPGASGNGSSSGRSGNGNFPSGGFPPGGFGNGSGSGNFPSGGFGNRGSFQQGGGGRG